MPEGGTTPTVGLQGQGPGPASAPSQNLVESAYLTLMPPTRAMTTPEGSRADLCACWLPT